MDNEEAVEDAEELIVWGGASADPNQLVKKPTDGAASPAIDDDDGIKKEEAGEEPKSKRNITAGASKGIARSHLYEICAVNHWKPPLFDCCKEEGPNHQKMFTFKVMVEINRGQRTTILVCFSNPKSKKKAAAENAAEGALWFLNHRGYHLKKR